MSSGEETSTSSESSPNTRLLRKMEQQINETPATTREEARQKLKQKLMVKRTQRLSRFGQKIKLDNMKQGMEEKMEQEKKLEQEKQEKQNKIREKRRLKRQRQKQRQKEKKLEEESSKQVGE